MKDQQVEERHCETGSSEQHLTEKSLNCREVFDINIEPIQRTLIPPIKCNTKKCIDSSIKNSMESEKRTETSDRETSDINPPRKCINSSDVFRKQLFQSISTTIDADVDKFEQIMNRKQNDKTKQKEELSAGESHDGTKESYANVLSPTDTKSQQPISLVSNRQDMKPIASSSGTQDKGASIDSSFLRTEMMKILPELIKELAHDMSRVLFFLFL